MKKSISLALFFLIILTGCQAKGNSDEVYVEQISSGYISGTGNGLIQAESNDYYMPPFNTEITGNLYYKKNQYSKSELSQIEESFQYYLQYYHALVDRHYDYKIYSSSSDSIGNKINNLKTINDSYGTESSVIVDEFLYDVLKASYEFTLNSDGRFNMFLGTLNDIYEEKFNHLGTDDSTALNAALSFTNDFQFSTDFDENEMEQTVKYLPTAKEELEGLLSFDDDNHSVTFHKLDKVTNKAYAPQISLGGNGKGYAIEKLSDVLEHDYPGISMLINGGHSSIKTIGNKPSSSPWKVKYTNPVYRERLRLLDTSSLKAEEVGISINQEFSLSTSAYYEQYFYVYKKEEDTYIRRSHILNPKTGYSESFFDQISVINDDAGLADMYTTALMNTTSVEEAYRLFENLNNIYQKEDSALILCYKSEKEDTDSLYQYKNSELSDLSSFQYPTLRKKADNVIYDGNYNDLTAKEIYNDYEPISKVERNFNETYYMTSNVYNNRIQIEDAGIAVVKEITL